MSRALSFDDQEGNGVELYLDRPRATWRSDAGTVRMGSEPLDPNAFVQRHLTESGAASGPTTAAAVGHVQLRVGDVTTARDFSVDTAGFAQTALFGSRALVVSAGGNHLHVGMNTGDSRGAGPRTPALGQGQVVLRLPARDELDALADPLRHRGVPVADDGAALSSGDPWTNRVVAHLA